MRMAINDVERERVYYTLGILCEFLGHNFVSGLIGRLNFHGREWEFDTKFR